MLVPNRHSSTDTYRYGFNSMERDDELKGKGNSYNFGARILDPRTGRFFSKDPILQPSESPYSFSANNPIIYVDVEGEDNIVYLVLLPSARESLSKKEISAIVAETNKLLADQGLHTRVVLFEEKRSLLYIENKKFDSRKIDETDTYVLLGSRNEIFSTIENNPENHFDFVKDGTYKSLGQIDDFNPELSVNEGQGIVINSDDIQQTSELLKTSKETATSYLIAHSIGHNAGLSHRKDNTEEGYVAHNNALVKEFGNVVKAINPNMVIDSEEGHRIVTPDNRIKTLGDVLNKKNNPTYSKVIEKKLGNNKPTDNYEKNKNTRQVGPVQKNGKF